MHTRGSGRLESARFLRDFFSPGFRRRNIRIVYARFHAKKVVGAGLITGPVSSIVYSEQGWAFSESVSTFGRYALGIVCEIACLKSFLSVVCVSIISRGPVIVDI